MDRTEIIERLKNIAEHAVHTVGERPFIMSLDDGIAVHEAIELLKKAETNCPEIPDSWIPVTKKMPEEKDTMFAKYWGTDRWNEYMFRGRSELVEVTVELEDGTCYTDASRTRDGKWDIEMNHGAVKKKVVAWKPMSAPWKEWIMG
jgi:hypothetical protein